MRIYAYTRAYAAYPPLHGEWDEARRIGEAHRIGTPCCSRTASLILIVFCWFVLFGVFVCLLIVCLFVCCCFFVACFCLFVFCLFICLLACLFDSLFVCFCCLFEFCFVCVLLLVCSFVCSLF